MIIDTINRLLIVHEQYVLRLQIGVDEAEAMNKIQRFQKLT